MNAIYRLQALDCTTASQNLETKTNVDFLQGLPGERHRIQTKFGPIKEKEKQKKSRELKPEKNK
jgi:hypothetical protein